VQSTFALVYWFCTYIQGVIWLGEQSTPQWLQKKRDKKLRPQSNPI